MSFITKLFMIDCHEAHNCCDKAQYKDAKPIEKFRLYLHLAVCKACRKYTQKNRKLSRLIKKSKLETCPEEKKKQWKEQITKTYVRDNV